MTTPSPEPDTPLTDAELDAIAARAEAATPGPWAAGWDGDPRIQSKDDAGPMVVVSFGRGGIAVADPIPAGHADTWDQVEHNLDFIAAARADIPRLVAEVRRLRAALGECLEEWNDEVHAAYGH